MRWDAVLRELGGDLGFLLPEGERAAKWGWWVRVRMYVAAVAIDVAGRRRERIGRGADSGWQVGQSVDGRGSGRGGARPPTHCTRNGRSIAGHCRSGHYARTGYSMTIGQQSAARPAIRILLRSRCLIGATGSGIEPSSGRLIASASDGAGSGVVANATAAAGGRHGRVARFGIEQLDSALQLLYSVSCLYSPWPSDRACDKIQYKASQKENAG